MIYKTLVLTGLRKGELASLTVGQLELDGEMPFVVLEAADEKNREGSTIPLRADLANDLREWLSDTSKPSSLRLCDRKATDDSKRPLFTVPAKTGANPQPRLADGWHRQVRRTRTNHRRSRLVDFVWHVA